jgi:excisionase family DNA binding protein
MPDLITIQQAAELLGVTPQAIDDAIARGRLRVVREFRGATGRVLLRFVRRSDVERYRRTRRASREPSP